MLKHSFLHVPGIGYATEQNLWCSSHGIGGSFGAASVLRLKEDLVRYALSYTAQQASGMLYWPRDETTLRRAFCLVECQHEMA